MKKFWSNSLYLFIGHVLVYLHGIILIPIIIKLAGASVFGFFSLLSSSVGLAYGVSSFGIGFVAKRKLPSLEQAELCANYFWKQFWVHLAFVILVASIFVFSFKYVVSGQTLHMIESGNIIFSANFLIFMYFIAYFTFAQATDYFRYTHNIKMYNISTVSFPYVYLFIVLLIHYLFKILSIDILFFAQAVSAAVIGGALLYLIRRNIGVVFRVLSREEIINDVKLGFPVILVYLVDVLLSSSDRFILGGVMSVKEVGYYVPAYTLGMITLIIPRVMGVILPAVLSKSIDNKKPDEAMSLIQSICHGYIAIVVPFVIGALITGKMVLSLYTSSEVANASWAVVPIVGLASVFYGLVLISINLFIVKYRTKELFLINLYTALLNIVMNFIFLPVFKSLYVPALTTVIAYVVSWQLINLRLKKYWNFSLSYKYMLKIIISSVTMGLVALLLTHALEKYFTETELLVITIMSSVATYGFLAFVTGIIDREAWRKLGILLYSKIIRNNV